MYYSYAGNEEEFDISNLVQISDLNLWLSTVETNSPPYIVVFDIPNGVSVGGDIDYYVIYCRRIGHNGVVSYWIRKPRSYYILRQSIIPIIQLVNEKAINELHELKDTVSRAIDKLEKGDNAPKVIYLYTGYQRGQVHPEGYIKCESIEQAKEIGKAINAHFAIIVECDATIFELVASTSCKTLFMRGKDGEWIAAKGNTF